MRLCFSQMIQVLVKEIKLWAIDVGYVLPCKGWSIEVNFGRMIFLVIKFHMNIRAHLAEAFRIKL